MSKQCFRNPEKKRNLENNRMKEIGLVASTQVTDWRCDELTLYMQSICEKMWLCAILDNNDKFMKWSISHWFSPHSYKFALQTYQFTSI